MAGTPLRRARKLGLVPPAKTRDEEKRERNERISAGKAAKARAASASPQNARGPARPNLDSDLSDSELVKLAKRTLRGIVTAGEGEMAQVKAAQILMQLEKNLDREAEEYAGLDLSSKTDAELEVIARGENPDPNREGIQ